MSLTINPKYSGKFNVIDIDGCEIKYPSEFRGYECKMPQEYIDKCLYRCINFSAIFATDSDESFSSLKKVINVYCSLWKMMSKAIRFSFKNVMMPYEIKHILEDGSESKVSLLFTDQDMWLQKSGYEIFVKLYEEFFDGEPPLDEISSMTGSNYNILRTALRKFCSTNSEIINKQHRDLVHDCYAYMQGDVLVLKLHNMKDFCFYEDYISEISKKSNMNFQLESYDNTMEVNLYDIDNKRMLNKILNDLNKFVNCHIPSIRDINIYFHYEDIVHIYNRQKWKDVYADLESKFPKGKNVNWNTL